MRSLLSRCLGGMLLVALAVGRAQAVDVRDVRVWASPESTRVVLDLSGSAQHSLQVLHFPERVVLDVSGARLAKGAHD
jgi:N-acetylmuramoyl-L-alanine amidase